MLSEQVSAITEGTRSIVAEDGYDLHYRVWAPPAAPAATMVMLNGVMSHSAWFQKFAESLAALSLLVVGADRRGSGLNSQHRGDAPSRHILVSDLRRIIEHESPPCGPVYLIGWCWGGVLAINAALEFGGLVQGIILLAPGLFPSEPVRLAIENRALRGNSPDVPCLASPIPEEMFTKGPDLDGFILKDNFRLRAFTPRFYGIMLRMGVVAVRRLGRLAQPILLILAAQDAAVDNRRTLEAFQKITQVPVTFATCNCQHGMQFEAPQELTAQIALWLNTECSRSIGSGASR